MGLKHLIRRVSSAATRHSSIEFYVHVLPAVLLLSAELLSAIAAGHFVDPVAESLPSTYLAMTHGIG